MATTKVYAVKYEVVKVNTTVTGGAAGFKYSYRNGIKTARVAAANPGAVAGVIAGDVGVGSGESIEVLDIHEDPVGLLT